MRKVILMVLLAFVSSKAMAEWVAYDTYEDGASYADPATRHRHGNMVKMWLMDDFNAVKTTGGHSYVSSIVQKEFDCEEWKFRMLSVVAHNESMGKGGVAFAEDDGPSRWYSVAPGSIGDVAQKIACAKK